jgi:putative restriction endonuclease
MDRTARKWKREEIILAFELYCTLPSNSVTIFNPQIKALASAIGRSANSVKLKLQNFKSYDPSYIANGRIGLSHGSKLDKQVVEEFISNWDGLVSEVSKVKNSYHIAEDMPYMPMSYPQVFGYEDVVPAKARVGQSFFRSSILAEYGNKCCVSGIDIPELLRASHIKPWSSSSPSEKVNPQNGLLINSLIDSAFDKGLVTIDTKFRFILSNELRASQNKQIVFAFKDYEGKQINLPSRFWPERDFIQYHNDTIFRR